MGKIFSLALHVTKNRVVRKLFVWTMLLAFSYILSMFIDAYQKSGLLPW